MLRHVVRLHQALLAVVFFRYFQLCRPQIIDFNESCRDGLRVRNEQLELEDNRHEVKNWIPCCCQDWQMDLARIHVDEIGIPLQEGRDQVATCLQEDLRCIVWIAVREEHLEDPSVALFFSK